MTPWDAEAREDGFGARRFESHRELGRVEVLDVCPPLATPAAEQAIRARAARLRQAPSPSAAGVLRVTRARDTLTITSAVPDGVTLAEVLASLEFGVVQVSDEALLELAGATARAVASLHQAPGGSVHGAITPSHVLLRTDGGVVLTGVVFVDALHGLQYNRGQLWRTLGLALPPATGLPRFDLHADVTQLAVVVLSLLLRRHIAPGEYPHAIEGLLTAVTARVGVGRTLRQWLLQGMHLHSRALFSSAVDAERAYTSFVPQAAGAREELQALVRQLRREPAPARVTLPAAAAAGFGVDETAFPALAAS